MTRRGCLLLVCCARVAAAQPAEPPASPPPPADGVRLGGYLELYGQWSFRDPSNGVTNLRGFDDRHATLAIQNAVIEATWIRGPVTGRIALQVGDAADNYYQAEPVQPAAGSAPASGPSEWRHLQEAWAAWTPRCTHLELAAGLFLSPIGPEVVPTRDDWNWSRSDLFFLLPYYHVGIRAKQPIGVTHWTAIAAIYNGYNNALDDNRSPSIDAIAAYASGAWSGQVQYFGGIERPPGAPEGQPWRHLFDAYVQGPIVPSVTFQVHADAGFEQNTFGTSSWAAVAGYLKYDVAPRVYVAARGDVFREWRAVDANPMFLPFGIEWIASATATIAWRPVDGFELRAEYRHDHASADAYFAGDVPTDPVSGAAIPNVRSQDTVTGGVIGWF